MNSLLLNLLYSIVLIFSGIIIVATLERFNMRVACIAFSCLLVVCLIYIPFYFGGNIMLSFFSGVLKDQTVAETFVSTMQNILTAPFWLFESVTVGMAIFSIIAIIAGIIATIALTLEVINYVRNRLKKVGFKPKRFKKIILDEVFLFINYRFLYKRLERYRN